MFRFILNKLTVFLLCFSLGGLLLCRLIDFVFFSGGHHLDQTAAGLWVLRFLAIIFAITTLALVPLNIVLSRREKRDVRALWAEGKIDPKELPPLGKFLFYSNYADVPKWIYFPFLILAWILVGFFLLSIIVWGLIGLAWLIRHLLAH